MAPAPDEHAETQLERTSLAWDRTGFASAGAALVLARLAASRGSWVTVAVSLSLALVAVGALLEAGHRHQGQRGWFAGEWEGTGLSMLAHATIATVVALAGAGALLILTT